MKKLALIFGIVLGFQFSTYAQHGQNTWGVKGGVLFPMDGFSFSETSEHIKSIFEPTNQITGWHAGIYGRAYMGNYLFAHSNLSYLNTKHQLQLKSEMAQMEQTIQRHGAQLEAGIGLEFLDFLRVQGGLNGLAYMGKDWNQTFDTFGAGYSFGAGVDLWKITVDVTYNGSFSNSEGVWNGIALSHNRSDLMLTLGICF